MHQLEVVWALCTEEVNEQMAALSEESLNSFDFRFDKKVNMENRTFSDDRFGWIEFAHQLNRLIQDSGRLKENESFTVAVDASWGMGKTQFLHMWRNMLGHIDAPFHSGVIYYNAWENDDSDDALTPLILHICGAYVKQKEQDEKTLDFMQKLLKVCFLSTLKIASLAFPAVSLLNDTGKTALEAYDGKKSKSALDAYQDKLQAKDEFRKAIRSLAGSGKLIIMIDELDRCRPLFAVRTLEAVKHFFNITNVVFVFALDFCQLSRSVEAIYGRNVDASGYLARFFDFRVCLNHPTAEQYVRCLPSGIYPSNSNSLALLDQTVRALSLSARETIMLLRIFSVFRTSVDQGPQADYATHFYFILLAVKYKEPGLFKKIIEGDEEALKTPPMYSKGEGITGYLQFAMEMAQMPSNLAESKLAEMTGPKSLKKPGDHIRLSLAKYFMKHTIANYPEERLFGMVLLERLEVFSTPMRQHVPN